MSYADKTLCRRVLASVSAALVWLIGSEIMAEQAPDPPPLPASATYKPPIAAEPAQKVTADVAPIAATEPATKELPESVKTTTPDSTTAEPCQDECPGFDWSRVPPARPQPRPGNFAIPPKGCGYYSFADWILDRPREAPPKYGYPPFALMSNSFFDADFRYVDSADPADIDWSERLKRIHLGDSWLFSTGGQASSRYMLETHSRLGLRDNVYDLIRARVYGDLWYQDIFRVYAEFISSQSIWQDLPVLPIDVNKSDFQNLFVDVKLFELDGRAAYARIGRQELLFGSQRLISPPDWANNRRTFQGVRAFRQGENFDVDLFWVQPVIPNPNRLDSVDNNQNFAGLWTTYRPQQGQAIDAYYLFLDNTNAQRQLGIVRSPYNVHTLGTRYSGDSNGFLWDGELALQLGRRGSQDIIAGMATTGLGYNFASAPLNPTFWVYYDYASGDHTPNSGNYSTFNQLFPFGHYYLGWADQIGRQNIHDLNVHLYLYPTKWITFWTQYHHFWLDQSRDALYNAAGNAIRRSANGSAGNNVGDEIDFVLNFHLAKRHDIMTGYSRLIGGDFLDQTKGANGSKNTDLFYLMYNYRW